MAKQLWNNEKALTLVEIIASLLILSIILIAIIPLFFTSAQTNEKSEEIINATYQAQNDLEEVRLLVANEQPSPLSLEAYLSDALRGYWGEGHRQSGEFGPEFVFERWTESYVTALVIRPLEDEDNLAALRVEVSPREDPAVTDSQMETIIQWKD